MSNMYEEIAKEVFNTKSPTPLQIADVHRKMYLFNYGSKAVREFEYTVTPKEARKIFDKYLNKEE